MVSAERKINLSFIMINKPIRFGIVLFHFVKKIVSAEFVFGPQNPVLIRRVQHRLQRGFSILDCHSFDGFKTDPPNAGAISFRVGFAHLQAYFGRFDSRLYIDLITKEEWVVDCLAGRKIDANAIRMHLHVGPDPEVGLQKDFHFGRTDSGLLLVVLCCYIREG